MMQDVSLAAAFGRLAIVAVLMAAVLLVLRRTTKRGRASNKRAGTRSIELIDRQPLGKTQSVAVLRVQDYTIVVGVTEQHVELLATLDAPIDDARDDGDLLDLTGFDVRDDDGDDDFFERLSRRSAR
jgi:flagellar biosynthetic protein FliO